jgi:hypothetical protein
MITDIIVVASIVFAAAFTAVWLISPGLRAWIERPKYRFLKDVGNYENSRSAPS